MRRRKRRAKTLEQKSNRRKQDDLKTKSNCGDKKRKNLILHCDNVRKSPVVQAWAYNRLKKKRFHGKDPRSLIIVSTHKRENIMLKRMPLSVKSRVVYANRIRPLDKP